MPQAEVQLLPLPAPLAQARAILEEPTEPEARALTDDEHQITLTINPEQPDKVAILSRRNETMDDPQRFDGTTWYAGAVLLVHRGDDLLIVDGLRVAVAIEHVDVGRRLRSLDGRRFRGQTYEGSEFGLRILVNDCPWLHEAVRFEQGEEILGAFRV